MTILLLRRALVATVMLAAPLGAQTAKQLAQLDTLTRQLASAQTSVAAARLLTTSATTALTKAQAVFKALVTSGSPPPIHDTIKVAFAVHDTVRVPVPFPVHDTVVITPPPVHDTIYAPPPVVTPPPVITPPVIVPPTDTTTRPPVVTPPSGTASCPNEPAGYTVINDNGLRDVPVWPATNSQGWIDDGRDATQRIAIVTDPTAPASPTVTSGLFPGGMPGGQGPFYLYRPFSAAEQFKNLYICVYVKHDANFDNTNGNAGTKFLWPAGDQVQGSMTYMTHNASTMDFGVNQQGAVDRMMLANMNASAAQMYSQRGQWVRYEILVKANTNNSTANGELHIWLNGVETHRYTNVNWQMQASRAWMSLAWNPTYGGGLHPVPRDQRQYLNGLRVSGSSR